MFPTVVALSCASADLPALSALHLQPSHVSAGSSDSNVRLNIVATAAIGTTAKVVKDLVLLWYGLGFSLAGVMLTFGRWRQRPRPGNRLLGLATFTRLRSGFASCGGGSSSSGDASSSGHPGTPPGNHPITGIGVMGSIRRSVQMALTVQ